VEVHSDPPAQPSALGHEVVNLARDGDADRVREDDLLRVGRRDPLGQLEHAFGRHATLERAAERDADRDRERNAIGLCSRADPLDRRERFLHGSICVPAVELLGGSEREVRLVEAGGAEPVVALLVQNEAGVDDSFSTIDSLHDLLGARHLRHPVRVDEAHGLDTRQARGSEPVDELGANGRLEHHALVLEPVTGADLADRHAHARERTHRIPVSGRVAVA
jgi:hypothetical protein